MNRASACEPVPEPDETTGRAVVLHTLWDSLDSLIAYVVLAVIALGLLGATTHRLARGGLGGSLMRGSTVAVVHDG